MADAADSKSADRKVVKVRLLSPAPSVRILFNLEQDRSAAPPGLFRVAMETRRLRAGLMSFAPFGAWENGEI